MRTQTTKRLIHLKREFQGYYTSTGDSRDVPGATIEYVGWTARCDNCGRLDDGEGFASKAESLTVLADHMSTVHDVGVR